MVDDFFDWYSGFWWECKICGDEENVVFWFEEI